MTSANTVDAQPKNITWHSQSAEDVLTQLGSSANGLSAQEAAQRLAADGANEIKEGKRISPVQIFLGQFKSILIWILIAAGVISGVLGEMVDAIAILAIVVLNAVIGFYQELNAEKSIAALKKMTAPQAKVRRDGQVASIPASGIVVGDILTLEAGDLVAADARLIEAAFLRCIESALTGESESVAMEFLFARNASGVHAWELDEALDPGRLDTKRYFDLLDRAMRTVLDPFKAGLPSLAMGRLL